MSPPAVKRAFVTVGSTKFDALIQQVLNDATIQAFLKNSFTDLVVQAGNSVLPATWNLIGKDLKKDVDGLTITVWRFKASLKEEIDGADLVISHAGSGTILDTLRAGKQLIVIPNNTLLDDHQTELAEALHERGHLIAASVGTLCEAIGTSANRPPERFPELDLTAFSRIVDEEMGFAW
ncbi:N-acetylglucosaminyldiphosphodolichol N-acetylglucosaminyltransferase catalytic subunit alg13 [Tulasnella sp. 424]|nr:N-acetylglucosaminyldiphosphodolichol N-acetylglucosaminyltransferase catalytic subunit alg13 [Tulasnella sp. 424]KAG8971740.1 N-acetylglucosaminyldiphosphodolichol N-acetylglucosaminyltransferase catalytic subunit alg13 [Tulasnella sp. 425]